MYYYCLDCGETFAEDETKYVEEWQGDDLHGGYIDRPICPYCNSENFDEIAECEVCGAPSDICHCGLCEECYQATIEQFEEWASENLTTEEYQELRQYAEGEVCDRFDAWADSINMTDAMLTAIEDYLADHETCCGK